MSELDWNEKPGLSHAFRDLRVIYSSANAIYSSHRSERFDFLLAACGDLSRKYRKKQTDLYAIALAQIFAWFMSLAESFFNEWGGSKISQAMCEKYPETKCGYCGKLPCECEESVRKEHTVGQYSQSRIRWSIRHWQQHLESLYGKVNKKRGTPRALNRLLEEVAEVGLLLHLAEGFDDSRTELENKIAREMTDVLAWVFGLASLLKVDLEKAILDVYKKGCPICRSRLCECRSFERRPQSGALAHRFMPAEEIKAALLKPPTS